MFLYTILFLLASQLILASEYITSNELLNSGTGPTVDAKRHHIVKTGFSPDSSRFSPICGKRGAGTCENTVGSYICKCNAGFKLTKSMCDDINECVDPKACGEEGSGRCENEVGSFKCHCNPGFRLLNNTCQDIDECINPSAFGEEEPGRCDNEVGSFSCQCNSGFQLINNKCQDIDECINQDTCGEKMAGSCQNTLGSYSCVCSKGFEIKHGKCHDTDECMNESPVCGTGRCENIPGSYKCHCSQNGVDYLSGNGNCTHPCEGKFKFFCAPGGHCNCYLIIKDYIVSHEVKQACFKMGAQPLKIRSAEENNFISSYALELFGSSMHLYNIGAHRVSGLQFAWHDGEQLDYTNWFEGDPNDKEDQDCVGAWSGKPIIWGTMSCNLETFPACQKPV